MDKSRRKFIRNSLIIVGGLVLGYNYFKKKDTSSEFFENQIQNDYNSPMVYINDGSAYYMEGPKNIRNLGPAMNINFLDNPKQVKITTRDKDNYIFNLEKNTKEVINNPETLEISPYRKRIEETKKSLENSVLKYDDFDIIKDKDIIYFTKTEGSIQEGLILQRKDASEDLIIGSTGIYVGTPHLLFYNKIAEETLKPWKKVGDSFELNPISTYDNIKISPDGKQGAYTKLRRDKLAPNTTLGFCSNVYFFNFEDMVSYQLEGDIPTITNIGWIDNQHLFFENVNMPRKVYLDENKTMEQIVSLISLDPKVFPRDCCQDILDADRIAIFDTKDHKFDILKGHFLEVYRD
jgi:hypothetical protein